METNIIIAGDRNKIVLNALKYERDNSIDTSDLNWIAFNLKADFVHFEANFGVNLTTNEMNFLFRQISDFLNEKINEVNYESEEENIAISIQSNNIGNLSIKGYLKKNDYGRMKMSFEFESNISYLEQTKKQLELITEKYKTRF